jgi:hypothetical protein
VHDFPVTLSNKLTLGQDGMKLKWPDRDRDRNSRRFEPHGTTSLAMTSIDTFKAKTPLNLLAITPAWPYLTEQLVVA